MFTCEVCNFVSDRSSKFDRHFQTEKHKRNVVLQRDFVATRREITSDKEVWDSEEDMEIGEAEGITNGNFIDYERSTDTPKFGFVEGELPPEFQSSDTTIISDSSDNEDYETDQVYGGEDESYFPFPNKTVFLLCTILYSNTLDVSDRMMSYFLFILKELGVSNVPTLKTLKRFHFAKWEDMIKKSLDEYGVPFYHLKMSSWLTQCMAHPTTANSIIRYPRKNISLSEQADGTNWMNNIQSFWGAENGRQFRTGQFVGTAEFIGRIELFFEKIDVDGSIQLMVVIDRFKYILVDGKRSLVWVEGESLDLPLSECTVIPVSNMDLQYKQSVAGQIIPMTQEEMVKCRHLKGDISIPVVTVPVNIFMDDTSANKSRRWKPIHAVQAQLSGLPLGQRDKSENVVFLAASEKVSIQSLAKVVLEEITEMKRKPIQTFDAKYGSCSTIVPDLGCFCLDGAMLSEVTNHLGASANFNCAVCKVHVDDSLQLGEKKSCEWLCSVLDDIEAATTERQRKQIQKDNGVKRSDRKSRVCEHVDIFRLVTFGSLHWFYLGIVRSTIKEIMDDLSESKKCRMADYLVGIDQSCFQNKISRDTVKYFQSRQGKDFKVLIQVMPFVGDFLQVKPAHLHCLINLALMTRFVESKSLREDDIKQFDSLINKHMCFAKESLQGLKRKQKTHSSLHVVADIKRHGPMPSYKEDCFEKKHGDIRRKLFHQNQLCRSRDTALAFAADMCLQHIVTGGFFLHGDSWLQAGDGVRNPCGQIKMFVIGRDDRKERRTGRLCVKREELFEADRMKLLQSFIDWKIEVYENCPTILLVENFRTVVCQSGDRAHSGSRILFKTSENKDVVGEYVRGFKLTEKNSRTTFWAEVCPYKLITPKEHQQPLSKFCPVLEKGSDSVYVPVDSVVQLVSIIHDCRGGRCDIEQHTCSTYPYYYLNNFRLSHPSSLLLS